MIAERKSWKKATTATLCGINPMKLIVFKSNFQTKFRKSKTSYPPQAFLAGRRDSRIGIIDRGGQGTYKRSLDFGKTAQRKALAERACSETGLRDPLEAKR